MSNPAYKRTTAGQVWQAVAAIVIGLFFLGTLFAWATDPRPVQGSPACRASVMLPDGPIPAQGWNAQRDCKSRFVG